MIWNCSYRSCKVKIQFIFLIMSQGVDAIVDTCYYVVNIILIHIVSCYYYCAYCYGCCISIQSISIFGDGVFAVIWRSFDQFVDMLII